jgi:hypothetical protein
LHVERRGAVDTTSESAVEVPEDPLSSGAKVHIVLESIAVEPESPRDHQDPMPVNLA